jgi:transcriptional regulator of arginine metabolism
VSTKTQRQQLIARLIAEHPVSSQPQLRDLLEQHGMSATQATVSRDLDDLGAVKVRAASGDTVYAIPEYEPDRLAPHEHLRRVFGEWVAEVHHNDALVVVRTPPGCAHVVASALDRSRLAGVLGTVAGDDTFFCVPSAEYGAARLSEDLRQLAGIESAEGSS